MYLNLQVNIDSFLNHKPYAIITSTNILHIDIKNWQACYLLIMQIGQQKTMAFQELNSYVIIYLCFLLL